VTVSVGYLEHLITSLNDLRGRLGVSEVQDAAALGQEAAWPDSSTTAQASRHLLAGVENQSENAVAPLVQDSTSESFLRKLKEVVRSVDGNASVSHNPAASFSPASTTYSRTFGESVAPPQPQRRYANMKFDSIRKSYMSSIRQSHGCR
jgi:hypothetical protein